MYDGIVRDNESGMEVESRHHNTSEEAIKHALRKLKELLHDKGVVGSENK